MRIYAIADIHGKEERLRTIRTVINQFQPELLIIAGDITNYLHPQKTLGQLEKLPIPILGIRGNSDLRKVEPLLKTVKNTRLLDSRPFRLKHLFFSGLNGTLALPFASRICLRETRALNALAPGVNKQTVMVAHPPPRGICDKVGNRFSAGSRNLKRFVEQKQPRILLCGHIHEQAGACLLKKTLVINCAMSAQSGGAIIEDDNDNSIKVNFLQSCGSSGMQRLFNL